MELHTITDFCVILNFALYMDGTQVIERRKIIAQMAIIGSAFRSLFIYVVFTMKIDKSN